MGFTLRKSYGIGPRFAQVRFNITQNGWSSTSLQLGPKGMRYTRNITTGAVHVDLPGPINWRKGANKEARGKGRWLLVPIFGTWAILATAVIVAVVWFVSDMSGGN